MDRKVFLMTIMLSGVLMFEMTNSTLGQKPPVEVSDKQIQTEWIFERTEGSKLVFENGKSIETNLFNLEYIGQVATEDKAPYFIFSGVDCDECDANISIYIHSPDNGILSVGSGQNRYGYPGREYYYEDHSLLYEARTFYGQVLENTKGVIWYQKTLMEDDSWKNSIFLVDLSNGEKTGTFLNDTGQFDQTISMLQEGLCKEIKGFNYTSEP